MKQARPRYAPDELKTAVEQLTAQRDIAQKMLADARTEAKQAEDIIHAHNIRSLRMYDSLMIEKIDLMGRLARIDQRICALGLKPAVTVGCGMSLDGVKDLGNDKRAS